MSEKLVVDPTRCTGHGLCAELLPEWIALDDWGYPMIDQRPLSPELRGHANTAVRTCPVLALRLMQADRS